MKSLIRIDGSYGEGGGQLLRSSLALSVVTGKEVEINNIRANRPKPGLKPQHHAVVSLLKKLSAAETEGLYLGSRTVRFKPHQVDGGLFQFDVGTAGSVVLILETCLLLGLTAKTALSIRIRGGTDVAWSPPWDFFSQVFLRSIRMMDIKMKEELHQRGYYPKGGGEATLHIQPIDRIKAFCGETGVSHQKVRGRIHVANLPDHIGSRMKHAAIKTCTAEDLSAHIKTEFLSSASAGTGITLWMYDDSSVLGVSHLGRKGVPAERIGEDAAKDMIRQYRAQVSVDEYLFDQILPFMVFADDDSICRVQKLSSHAKTNLWLIKQFVSREYYSISKKKNCYEVRIKGMHNML